MTKIGTRPRWKRILYLECIAFTHKRHIAIEGYAVLTLGILLSPLWVPCLGSLYLMGVIFQALRWPGQFLTERRTAPYGGIDIAEENKAARRWSWFGPGRRMSLSPPARPRDIEEGGEEMSLLLRLPVEIRLEVFSYLVCPDKKLTICSMKEQRRLVAVPTRKCEGTHDPASAYEREKRTNLKEFLAGKPTGPGPSLLASLCEGKLALAKVNRQLYISTPSLTHQDHR